MRIDTRRIKIRLAELEMNQSDLAVKMGATRANVSRYIRGQISTFRTLERLAKFIDINPIELLIED